MTAAVSLRWRPFRLPMRARFEAAHGALEAREGVLIELIDTGGVRGIGEASPMPSLGAGRAADVIALLEEHGVALLNAASPLSSNGEPALSLSQGAGLRESPGLAALRCALDVAALDLEARAAGKPIAAMLTERPAEWVQANAVIGGGSPEEVARYGAQAVEAGYSVLKVKVGVAALEGDVRRIEALRAACPRATIRLDANGAWDEAGAGRALEALYPSRIELVEQPVPAAEVEALARVRASAAMRIAADEAVAQHLDELLERRAVDLIVLKPMLLGGLRPAMQAAARAAERGIGALVTTTFDSSIGTAAALHLAAALPVDAAHGLGTGEHLAGDIVATTLVPRSGRMTLSAGPGLGVEVDEAALDRVATGPWRSASA